jgi:hypothetical protein
LHDLSKISFPNEVFFLSPCPHDPSIFKVGCYLGELIEGGFEVFSDFCGDYIGVGQVG